VALDGGRDRRGQVLRFVKVGEGNVAQALAALQADDRRLADENAALRAENQAMKAQNQALAARLDRLEGAVRQVLARGAGGKLASLR
jgi:hypothetical protein